MSATEPTATLELTVSTAATAELVSAVLAWLVLVLPAALLPLRTVMDQVSMIPTLIPTHLTMCQVTLAVTWAPMGKLARAVLTVLVTLSHLHGHLS